MKKIYKIICMLALLPLFAGCNDTDDVEAIFTGKTWKLTLIAHDDSGEWVDFWGGDREQRENSLKKLNMGNTFTIRFEGATKGDAIQGQVSGQTVNSQFNGSWSANGKSNKFKASVNGNNDGDILALNFLKGINNATLYEGDNRNLYLLYKEGSATYRMFFHVTNLNQ